MTRGREWHLVRRPDGWPVDRDVALVEVDVPDPGPGELLVRNAVMSVEPYMRGRMSAAASYAEPWALGAPMSGHAVGEVVASGDDRIAAGAFVVHERGWREYALVRAADVRVVDGAVGGTADGVVGATTDGEAFPLSTHLGVLGLTGMTAYVGLLDVAGCRPGETVFVSAGAGAVGATAGQIAKARGCRVIGSAGSPEKVRFMTGELGFDAAFDYHDGPVRRSLSGALDAVGRDGIDVFFDNVGGEQLEAGIRAMRTFGRIALCGAISVYNSAEPVPGPRNMLTVILRRLRLEGFLLGDHAGRRPDFERDMSCWLRDGSVRNVETAVDGGIEAAWPAFLAMLRGRNVGKMVVRLAPAGDRAPTGLTRPSTPVGADSARPG
ncbi:MAG: NADP-dependent oxidoreductase [Frankia sp.]